MTEIKNQSGAGQVQIADEVIAAIAGTAALEIDGIAGMAGNLPGNIAEMLGQKNLAKGVKIEVSENSVTIDLHMTLKYGFKIQEVSVNVQKRVKTAVETMTGLTVSAVNVFVSSVHMEKEKPKNVSGRTMDNEL